MNIMKSAWVTELWEKRNEDILAVNDVFNKYKVPAFFNLGVIATGLRRKEKEEVKELVVTNGGTYYEEFGTNQIDLVIAQRRDASKTEKLKTALIKEEGLHVRRMDS